MAVKASEHSEPRGALCSISCQPSAADSARRRRDDKQKVSAMSAEAIGS